MAGKKETVSKAIQKCEKFRTELLERGVLLIPVIFDDKKKNNVAKKGFGVSAKVATSLPSIGVSSVLHS